jgi:hypothetical protein
VDIKTQTTSIYELEGSPPLPLVPPLLAEMLAVPILRSNDAILSSKDRTEALGSPDALTVSALPSISEPSKFGTDVPEDPTTGVSGSPMNP